MLDITFSAPRWVTTFDEMNTTMHIFHHTWIAVIGLLIEIRAIFSLVDTSIARWWHIGIWVITMTIGIFLVIAPFATK